LSFGNLVNVSGLTLTLNGRVSYVRFPRLFNVSGALLVTAAGNVNEITMHNPAELSTTLSVTGMMGFDDISIGDADYVPVLVISSRIIVALLVMVFFLLT
jgi:hypothetical protein